MTSLMTSLRIIIVATLELNISERRPDSGMVPMDSLHKLAHGLSIAHTPYDITWPDDVIMVTSSFSFKMLLLWQFLSELDHDTLTQCSPMVLTDSRSGSYDVTDDVITYNHCRNFGAKYLGNDARQQDGLNVQPIGTCVWTFSCACSRWRHVTGWRHNGVTFFL